MIYLDIETLDFFQDPHIAALPRPQQLQAIRFGIAVTFDDYHRNWHTWHQTPDLWRHIRRADICGWNIKAFDLRIIRNDLVQNHGRKADDLEHLGRVEDLMEGIANDTGRWYKLEEVALANFGRRKIADGQVAAEWLRDGNTEQASRYCADDVDIVYWLHQRILGGGSLALPAKQVRGEWLPEMAWRPNGR